MLVKSKYTIIKKCEEGYLFFNTKNGAQVFIKDNSKELINDILF